MSRVHGYTRQITHKRPETQTTYPPHLSQLRNLDFADSLVLTDEDSPDGER